MLMLRRVVVVMAGVLAIGLLGALGAGSAWGSFTYPLVGQLAPAGGSFGNLETGSVAVGDANGKTYVADSSTRTVDVFETATGTPLASWNGSAASNPPGTPAGSFGNGEIAVAANNASGAVFVLDTADNVVDEFDAAGSYVCQITGSAVPSASECNGVAGSATPAGGFNRPRGIGMDQATGEVYVVDARNGVLDIFSAAGAYLRQISLASIPGGFSAFYMTSVAVNDFNGHVYVSRSDSDKVYEFNATDEFVAEWAGANTPAGSFGGGYVSVAADDTRGLVYITDSQHNVTDVFRPSGAYDTRFTDASFAGPQGTAVDQASGGVLVANRSSVVDVFGLGPKVPDVTTESAGGVGPTSATLSGTVNPDGVQLSDCHFDYGTDTQYGQSAPCVPGAASIPADSSEHAVTAALAGLAPGTTYHFRLVASNANGATVGRDATFTTLPQPSVEDVTASNLTGASADLAARVNPNGYDTTYHFEWGTSTAYGSSVPVPDADAGAGTAAVAVSAHLGGLSADTTYHWRVVASNANGTVATGDHTFIYATAGAPLPDGRAYEMVTPVQKNVALIGLGLSQEIVGDVAESGSRVILPSVQCFAGTPSCVGQRVTQGDPYEFTRTPSGWTTVPLAPPAGDLNTWWSFSADSGLALFTIPTVPGNEDDWYASGGSGSLTHIGPVTPPSQGAQLTEPAIATSDMSHVVWLTLERWPFDVTDPMPPHRSVYEYEGSDKTAPVLVGVSGGVGSTDLISACGTEINETASGGLSADGRVVFFNAEACSTGSGMNAGVAVPSREVWARIDGARSVRLSARSPSDCSGVCLSSREGRARFWGASADGSKAFFTSVQQLTNDANQDSVLHDEVGECAGTTGVNGCNLYLYDFSRPANENLIDVSAGDTSGGGPRVRGVMDVSSDGSHVYFVAQGVLAQAPNDRGESAKDGVNNLYVYERDAAHPEGHTAFIASLSSSDRGEWGEGGFANVTPDGRFLVFRSHGDLTADDTSASGASQLFRYDAQSGQLIRISVGDRGFDDNGNRPLATTCITGGAICPEDVRIVPPKAKHGSYASQRLDPTMSHDGSYVFFTSPVALAPGALDDVLIGTSSESGLPSYAQNVYEWHAGRVYLISDGRDTSQHGSESNVWLLGSDATGANVFFSTADPLVAGDTDTQLDIYDARVCTVGEPCMASAAPVESRCQGEACHAPPGVAPGLPSLASSTLAGAGNLTPAPAMTQRKAVAKKHPKPHKRRRVKKKGKRGRKAVAGHARGKSGVRS
jgi:hypothetical protein